jgi:putative nucleotidyltransferase with HDIG domain
MAIRDGKHEVATHSAPGSGPGQAGSAMSALSSSDPHAAYLARTTELVLRELEQLPTLPSVATRLLQLGSSEDIDIREIARVVQADPGLTLKLLSLCKRAATRTRVPVTTVDTAIVMLGLDAFRALVLSVEIFEWTSRLRRGDETIGGTARGSGSVRPGGKKPGDQPSVQPITLDATRLDVMPFSRTGFWQHSIAVACAADLITREHPHLEFRAEEAFVCGLVHDIGKLALEWVLPKAYARVIDLAAQHQADISDFERAVVGLDHASAGARLAERWGLPNFITTAIALHHRASATLVNISDAGERRAHSAAQVVGVADALCRKLGLGWSGNHVLSIDDQQHCIRAGLLPERVEAASLRLHELTAARCKDMGLGEEPSQQLLIDSVLRANARLGRLSRDLAAANAELSDVTGKLAEARSLTRLGQMTAGAAHEMNTPLAVISGRAQWLVPRQRDDKDKQAAQAILDATTRLSHLITRLNRIAVPGVPEPDAIDIGAMLSDAIGRARARNSARMESEGIAGPMVPIKLSVEEHLPLSRFDRAMITDAMFEILVNALEAYPKQAVRVSAASDETDGSLVIRIDDDGVGMSETSLAHAVDPFYSSKPAGRQTGLGLALADRLIRLHDGVITLSSIEGKGTQVEIRFSDWRAERPRGLSARAA